MVNTLIQLCINGNGVYTPMGCCTLFPVKIFMGWFDYIIK